MDAAAFPKRQELQALLGRAGFDANEIDVYLALLSLKTAPVSTIAKRAKQGRSNTYILLRNLEKRGLVARMQKQKLLYFVAQSPKRLTQYLEREQQILREIQRNVQETLPYLESLGQLFAGQPRVTVSQGFDQMRIMYREFFENEIIGFFNPEGMYQVLGGASGETFFDGKLAPRGRELIVSGPAAKAFQQRTPRTDTYDYRFLPPHIRFNVDLFVFGETVSLFCFDEDLTCVRIDNRNFADTLRAFFEVLWPLGTGEIPDVPPPANEKR